MITDSDCYEMACFALDNNVATQKQRKELASRIRQTIVDFLMECDEERECAKEEYYDRLREEKRLEERDGR